MYSLGFDQKVLSAKISMSSKTGNLMLLELLLFKATLESQKSICLSDIKLLDIRYLRSLGSIYEIIHVYEINQLSQIYQSYQHSQIL